MIIQITQINGAGQERKRGSIKRGGLCSEPYERRPRILTTNTTNSTNLLFQVLANLHDYFEGENLSIIQNGDLKTGGRHRCVIISGTLRDRCTYRHYFKIILL